ncbi:5'-nucleotidase C-terminal domain-containing protein [Metabacillus arenae]|uniref:5'-nucleotidase C-terminal domain-containing protein n=1 Tax=Metabacillus arenae TaxID=2771434 RepID=A0A926NEB3_9BACI|nr:5'-nucleotidase C-terminal domain-containing protein [Metabacillus arenae]MBD1379914.1 5'-nucleotidase C-terminal domain-containing protein [Metabacillus arenae]
MSFLSNRAKKPFIVVIVFLLLVTPFLSATSSIAAAVTEKGEDLFFSEYIEGSSNNKAIEIYNVTGKPVDLNGYVIELYSNGKTEAGSTLELQGTLENNDVYVIAHAQANETIAGQADTKSGVANFNGDDALVLKKNNQVIDTIHTVGSNEEIIKDLTLVRKSSILKGNQTFTLGDWEQFGKDTFTNIGLHTIDDQASEEPPSEEPPAEEVTVKAIQDIRVTNGGKAAVEGTVTAIFVAGGQANVYIQDDTAGIIVRGAGLENKVQVGDKIRAEGETFQYYDMAQLNATSDKVTIIEKNAGTPSPQDITSTDLTEAVEGEYVQIKNIEIDSVNGYGEHTAHDENGTFIIDSELVEVNKSYDAVAGVVDYSFGSYRLVPRNSADVMEDNSKVSSISATPESGLVAEGTKVELTTSTEGAAIYYTTDGSEPSSSSAKYSEPIEIKEAVTIKAVAIKGGLENSDVASFPYEIGKDLNELEIHDIQGAGHTSPYEGKTVANIDGIVTHIDGANIYIQEPNPDENPKTSEGLLIYKRNHGAKVGDHINVAGQVKEYFLEGYAEKAETDLAFTEINAASVEVLSNENELPEPIILGKDGRVIPSQIIDNDSFGEFDPEEDAIDFYESLEGMRTQLNSPKVVGPQEYGDIAVVVDNGSDQELTQIGGYKLTKEDPNPEIVYVQAGEDFVTKVGDSFNGSITGVMSYDYGTYKLYRDTSEELPELIDGGLKQENTTIEKDEDKLSVATYNMENFSAKSPSSKVENIAKSIIENLNTPDIIGLVEVQDNDGGTDSGVTNADETYKVLVDKIKELGGPAYEFTDIAPEDKQDGGAPGGNIRVGYLYNPERVSLADGEKGSATEAVNYENGDLTLNPGRIAPDKFPDTRKSLAAEFEFNGEEVIVINNHFNSKTGDSPLFGQNQPPVIGSEAERIKLMTEVNSFIKNIMAENKDANVVVLGDMNDFEFSKPLEALKGSELKNMIEQLPEEERWTYNYRGNSQTLDHILVNNRLAKYTEVDIVNINSPFMEEHGRASDHDPILVQVDLTPPNTINILHTNDSHARVFEGGFDGMGFAKLSTLVKQFESENEHSLLLDAGDTFHGTTFATLEQGSSIVEIMNKIGYDSMAAGNHDFNYGYKRLLELEEMADFPVLSANVIYEETGELVLDPYTIKNVNGVKLGIFGLSTPETHYKTHPKNVEGLKFTDPVKAANKMVKELQAQDVDAIIALTHLGTDASSTDTSLKVAQGAPGIDLIVDGHSHTVDDIENSGTLIVSAGEYLKNLGTVELTFDENNELISREAALITKEDAANIEPDPAVEAVIKEIEEAQKEILAEEIGTTTVKLDGEREHVRAGETNLGNLITDSMLEVTGADVVLTNGGGIRASIDEGVITKGEVITVLPFGNYIQTIDVPGSAIKEALENGVSAYPEVKGAFPHVGGMTFAIDASKPAGERVHSIKINGEPIDMNATYMLATNDFLAAGGDEYTVLANYPVTGDYPALDEAVMDYIKKRGTISPKIEGRIVAAETPKENPDDDNDGEPGDPDDGNDNDGQPGDPDGGNDNDGQPGDPDGGNDNDGEPGDSNDGNDNDGEPGDPNDGNDNDGEPGDPDDGNDNDGQLGDSDDSNDNGNQQDNELPNTATSSYNFLAWGTVFLLLGGILTIIRKKKSVK